METNHYRQNKLTFEEQVALAAQDTITVLTALTERYAKHPKELREQLIAAHLRAAERPFGAVDAIESCAFDEAPDASTPEGRIVLLENELEAAQSMIREMQDEIVRLQAMAGGNHE